MTNKIYELKIVQTKKSMPIKTRTANNLNELVQYMDASIKDKGYKVLIRHIKEYSAFYSIVTPQGVKGLYKIIGKLI